MATTEAAGPAGVRFGALPQGQEVPQPQRAVSHDKPSLSVVFDNTPLRRDHNPGISVRQGGLRPTFPFGSISASWKLRGIQQPTPEERLSTLGVRDSALRRTYWESRWREAEAEVEAGEVMRITQVIRRLLNAGTSAIIAVCNFKSSSKTLTGLAISSLIGELSRKPILMMPATGNSATSNVGHLAGIDKGVAITVTELSDQISQFTTARVAFRKIPTTSHGVSIVSEDNNEGVKTTNIFTPLQFLTLVVQLLNHYNVLVFDLGNDNIAEGSIGLWAVRLAHALVFPVKANDADTAQSLQRTVRACYADQDQTMPERFFGRPVSPADVSLLYQTGFFVPTPDKVANATIVETTVDPAAAEHGFDVSSVMKPPERELPEWRGALVRMPYQPWIRYPVMAPDGVRKPYSLDQLDSSGYRAVLTMTSATLEAARRAMGLPLVGSVNDRPQPVVDYYK